MDNAEDNFISRHMTRRQMIFVRQNSRKILNACKCGQNLIIVPTIVGWLETSNKLNYLIERAHATVKLCALFIIVHAIEQLTRLNVQKLPTTIVARNYDRLVVVAAMCVTYAQFIATLTIVMCACAHAPSPHGLVFLYANIVVIAYLALVVFFNGCVFVRRVKRHVIRRKVKSN